MADVLHTLKFKGLKDEELEMLLSVIPTTEEVQVLNDYGGDPSKLTPASSFLRTLSSIPRISNKLEVQSPDPHSLPLLTSDVWCTGGPCDVKIEGACGAGLFLSCLVY